MRYTLITPARNEGAFIRKTLDSVVAQTLLPAQWVIVDDGSTDDTAEVVDAYARRHAWIKLIRRPKDADRSFAAKVQAFDAGMEQADSLPVDVIGNLDADISFDADYLAFLMGRFAEDPRLGVAGTPFVEAGYDSARDSLEGENHVAGGCQLFRYRCFQEIGGYTPNRRGGIDWVAVTSARMKGWTTRSFREKRFHHYRTLGTAEGGVLSAQFSYGRKDYYLGGSPVWQVFRVAYRLGKKPLLLGGLALLSGYGWSVLLREERAVTPELMRFHRREQMKKLKAILGTLLRFKRVDNFALRSGQEQPH